MTAQDKSIQFNPRFNYCIGNIQAAKVRGSLSTAVWFNKVRSPSEKIVSLMSRIRSEENKAKRDKLKVHLPSVTPAVRFATGAARRYANIRTFTGIMMLDFDGIDFADEFRDYLFNEYPFIVGAWLSSSGKGCRAMVRIPVCNSTNEFKQRFGALSDEMKQYQGFDRATQNSVLPLFYSIDAEAKFDLMRIAVFRAIKTPPPPKPMPQLDWRKPDDRQQRWAENNTIKAIEKITDNGHPQLRGASFALGGYVGAGYMSESEAIDLIDTLIDSNSYLNKKPDVYKKTARQMIKSGISKPITL